MFFTFFRFNYIQYYQNILLSNPALKADAKVNNFLPYTNVFNLLFKNIYSQITQLLKTKHLHKIPFLDFVQIIKKEEIKVEL